MLAATLGCSPVIALGESFAGVAVGGRTGLTAIFNGLFFALALPLAPVFAAVPEFASAPVLVLLGVDLLSLTKFLDLDDATKALPSFCTIALMPYLYSIDRAIIAGLVAYYMLALLFWIHAKYTGTPPASAQAVQAHLVPDAEPAVLDEAKDDDAHSTTSSQRAYNDRTGIVVGYEEYYREREGGYLVSGNKLQQRQHAATRDNAAAPPAGYDPPSLA